MQPLRRYDGGTTSLLRVPSRLKLELESRQTSQAANARVAWNARIRAMTVHALRDIQTSEEITVAYCYEIQEGGGSRASRQATMQQRFNFQCRCALCAMGDVTVGTEEHEKNAATQLRRARIVQLAGHIADCPRNLTELVEERLRLQHDEGLGASIESMAVAWGFLRFIGDEAGAQVWATRAAESARLGLGEDSEEYLRWVAHSCGHYDDSDGGAQQEFMMALATFNMRSEVDCGGDEEEEEHDGDGDGDADEI